MTAPKPRIIDDEYQPDSKLEALALDLDIINRRYCQAGGDPREIRAYLRGYADAKLKRLPDFVRKPANALPVGVRSTRNGRRFEARITAPGTPAFIGTFDTPEEAHEAFKQKHVEVYGDQSRYFSEFEEASA